MIRNIILEQKNRRDKLLKEQYIYRDQTAKLVEVVESNLIKVVLGPRRAGKSFFAIHTFKPDEAAYVNFDDENLLQVKNYDDIIKNLLLVYGQTKYLLLDEVQNLPRWELFVNRLQREGYNLLVTGSNSKLLSKELATHLTGRHLPIELLPFSFKEFLALKKFSLDGDKISLKENKAQLLSYLGFFLQSGGFPELLISNLKTESYLSPLIESLLFKDVIKRYKLRKSGQIYDLESYLINNTANEFTYERLANNLQLKSWATVVKYLSFLEEAYLLVTLGRYSHKTAQRLKSPKKAYMIDNGFFSAKAVSVSLNSGRLMENLIFTELLKMGRRPNMELFYYKTRNNREIDFVVRQENSIQELIQVAYEINGETEQREIKALLEAQEELNAKKLTILTWDEKKEVEKDGLLVHFVPLWEWLSV